jgi:hypothetical protein
MTKKIGSLAAGAALLGSFFLAILAPMAWAVEKDDAAGATVIQTAAPACEATAAHDGIFTKTCLK